MKEIIKNYNFCDLSFDFEDTCVNKNTLTINECVNVSFNNHRFKPSCDYDDIFTILGNEIYDKFLAKYSDYIGKFIYINCFNYFDKENLIYKNLYLLIDSEFNLYKLLTNDDVELVYTDIKFNKMPLVFNANGKIYFYVQNDKFIYFEDDKVLISISNFVDLISFSDFQDKTFFVCSKDYYSVFYSDKIEIENINEDLSFYQSINVDSKYGKIIKLIRFKNNLYIIQQYAISRVWQVSGEYYIYSNCSINSKIIESSIGELNDYLIFYSSAGLFIFDGNEIKEIYKSTSKRFLKSSNVKALVFNNKYYLLLSMFLSGNYQKVLIEFDLDNNIPTINMIGDITDLFLIQSIDLYNIAVVCKSDDKYHILKLNNESFSSNFKYIKFNKILFDDNFSKKIMNIKTISNGEFYLKISSDISQKIIKVTNNLNIFSLGLLGYYFDIEVYSNSYFDLQSIIFAVHSTTE